MENVRILNRIVEINIANVKYADIELCGNTCFVGTNNFGKTSLQRAILFFYSANSRGLGIAQSQKSPAEPGGVGETIGSGGRRVSHGIGLADGFFHQFLQFAALVKLQGDVATADQFAADIDLGKSGPVGIARQVIENLRVFHYVHVGKRQAGGRQCLGCALRETAARHLRGAFHVDNHRIRFHLLFDQFQDVHYMTSG